MKRKKNKAILTMFCSFASGQLKSLLTTVLHHREFGVWLMSKKLKHCRFIWGTLLKRDI